jgi:6-phosphogluconolactonase/glucosamine-6-phosphate isomerase/deaminase
MGVDLVVTADPEAAAAKAAPLARALSGAASPMTPASLVRSRRGRTTALVDRAAAAWL